MLKNLENSIAIMLIMLFGNLSICLAQEITNKNIDKDNLISKGSNKTGVGDLKVTTYRLEKITLKKPVDLRDGKPSIGFAFRLMIMTEKNLPVSAFTIWLGDMQLNTSAINPKTVGVDIYKRTLPDGATLALSKYGEIDLATRSILPETLRVPSEYATSLEEIEANRPIIQLRRLATQSPLVELRIEIPGRQCYIGNLPLVIDVGGREFGADCDDDVIIFRFSDEIFTQLNDGAEVALKYGGGRSSTGRLIVGRLDKSSIQ